MSDSEKREHHGGFAANEWSPNNDPRAFVQKLRGVLE